MKALYMWLQWQAIHFQFCFYVDRRIADWEEYSGNYWNLFRIVRMLLVLHEHQWRRLTKRLFKPYVIIFTVLLLVLMHLAGLFSHLMERNYRSEFSYPLNIELGPIIASLRKGETPSVKPINLAYDVPFILPNPGKCQTQRDNAELHLVLVIKSDVANTYQRNAIRIAWGQENSIPGARVKRVFLVGTRPWEPDLQERVEAEQVQYADLVQGDFWDTYYNNTYKTMMGFKWVVKLCSNTQYAFFVDDDMYVSVQNLLHFLRNPTSYPEYLKVPSVPVRHTTDKPTSYAQASVVKALPNSTSTKLNCLNCTGVGLPQDVRLFSGFVFPSSSPFRHKFSKWYVSLSEYPYNKWPPYVTAGAFVLSRSALVDMYYASFYTRPFRFDDIYVAIVATKVGVVPYHSDAFHFWKKAYTSTTSYKHVIASHGYASFQKLLRVWGEQRQAGYA